MSNVLENPRVRCVRVLVSVLMFAVAGFAVVSGGSVWAQSYFTRPNATVRGDLPRLRELPKGLQSGDCSRSDCSVSIRPIHLVVSVHGYPSVRIVFDQAQGTRFVHREGEAQSVNDIVERPVLLRGVGVSRHGGKEGAQEEFPVAGAIYQDNGILQLEVSLSHLNRRAEDRIVVARGFLESSTDLHVMRARAAHSSSRAFVESVCGTEGSEVVPSRENRVHQDGRYTQASVSKILYLGTHFDREFMRVAKCKTASRCNNRILGLVNQASVHYRRQLGTALRVVQQYGPVQMTAKTSNPSQMLDNYERVLQTYYASVVHDGVNQGETLVDGFAGFTGQNMRGRVIGIATMGSYCDNASPFGPRLLVRYTSESQTSATVAHELGHNLNASHTSSGLMAPSTSGNDRQLRFAKESIKEISSYINAWYGDCRAGKDYSPPQESGPNAPALDLRVGRTEQYDISVEITVSDRRPNCVFVVKAAEAAAGIDSSVVVLEEPSASASFGISSNISTAINAANRADATIYFKGFYVCDGGEVRSQSSVEHFTPSYGPSLPDSVTRGEWIQNLRGRWVP